MKISYTSILSSFIVCVFTLSLSLTSWAQTAPSDDLVDKALAFSPVSPEAASLGKYGEIPVNLATGKINYTVPLYTIKVGSFEWPIYLSYNYSGLKTEEDPGVVGLGWDLMAYGRITQEVRGVSDQTDNSSFMKDQVYPYLNGDFNSLPREDRKLKFLNIYQRIAEGLNFDSQPDQYHVNAGSLQGSFFYDINGNIVFSVHKNYLVNGDVITDDKGVKYYFEEDEESTTETNVGDTSFPMEVKSRLLTKIELPDNKGEITFEYHPESNYSPYRKTTINETKVTGAESGFTISPQESIVYTRLLKQITFPNGYMTFDISTFESDSRTGNTLNKTSIYNDDGTLISQYEFEYNNASRFKKVLKKVTKTKNSAEIPFYEFEYYDDNSLRDNFHYSSQDFWGYYTGRGSNLNSTLMNANRELNFNSTRIGALKKILYPTGGSSFIEYESNQVSDIGLAQQCSYVHDKTHSFELELLPEENQRLDSIIDVGAGQIVRVVIKARIKPVNNAIGIAEINFNADSEGYLDCNYSNLDLNITLDEENLFSLDESQANEDGEFVFVEEQVAYAASGKIKLSGDLYTSSDNSVKLQCVIYYEERANSNSTVGGIRVKSVTDSNKEQSIKSTYYYLLEDGKTSSGDVLASPKFKYSVDINGAVENSGTRHYYSIRSKQPFTSYQNVPAFYDRVEVIKNDGAAGKIVKTFTSAHNSSPPFPFAPIVNNDWKKGKLLTQESYKTINGEFQLQEKVENNYKVVHPFGKELSSSKLIRGLVVARNNWTYTVFQGILALNVFISDYVEDQYTIYPKAYILEKTIKTRYQENGQSLTTTTGYDYDTPQTQLKQSTASSSDGNEQLTTLTYSYEEANHLLTAQNRIATPIQTTTYLKRSATDSLKLSTQKTTYKAWDNGLVLPEYLQTAKGTDALENRVQYESYDPYGNPQQVRQVGGTPTTYLWGYDGQYLIAKIEGATYSEVETALGGLRTINETHLNSINSLRSSKTQWLITTYEHKPLVGITKITAPNGISTTYDYDDFNRLKTISDPGGTLQEYEYHYANPSNQ